VAIVGAGPAGLSAAYHAVRHRSAGRDLRGLPDAGGLLRSASRQPGCRATRSMRNSNGCSICPGITAEPARQRLGRDVSLDELRRSHAAVMLGPARRRARPGMWPVAVPADLHEGLQLLRDFVDHGRFPKPKG
jgi:formate dehydrogenase beta subunit